MLALLACEWRRLWVRPLAWVMAAVVLAVMAWELVLALGPFLARQSALVASGANVGYTGLVLLPWLALFVFAAVLMAPLLTMATLAGERRAGTLALLFASGLSPTRIVVAKYLAALVWLLLILAAVIAMPLALSSAGAPDWGRLGATFLALALLLALLTAIGVACSAYTPHPAVAVLVALIVSGILFALAHVPWHHGMANGVAHWLALPTHLQPMAAGLVTSVDVAWFLIGTLLALALAVHRVGQQKDRD